jgi:hypothetical protein
MAMAVAVAWATVPWHHWPSRDIRHCRAAFVVDNDNKTGEMWMLGVFIMERGSGQRQQLE